MQTFYKGAYVWVDETFTAQTRGQVNYLPLTFNYTSRTYTMGTLLQYAIIPSTGSATVPYLQFGDIAIGKLVGSGCCGARDKDGVGGVHFIHR